MLATLAAIGAVLFIGVSNFLGPFLTRRTPLFTVVSLGQVTPTLILALLICIFALPLPSLDFLLIGALTGVISTVGTLLAFKAGQIGNIGLVAVILSLTAVIPSVAGIIEGERPPLYQWIGIALAVGGTWMTLLTGDRLVNRAGAAVTSGMPVGAGAVPARPSPVVVAALKRAGGNWPLMAIGAATCFGVFLLMFSKLAKQDLIWATFLSRVGTVFLAGAVIVAASKPLLSAGGWRRQLLPLPILGITMTTAILLFGYASTSSLTIAAALTAFSPVVSVSLSWIFLRDRLTRVQILGIALAVIGLILIAI